MATSTLRNAWKSLHRSSWRPLVFPKEVAGSIPADKKIEEETLPGYLASRYYPVQIGQIFHDRYQVVGKLGYGITSTVWLARDLEKCQHVALKLYVHSECMGSELGTELEVYSRIEDSPEDHPGRSAVRSLLDCFDAEGPGGWHRCLIHLPLWDSVLNIRHRNPARRLPPPILALILKRTFLALDLLHRHCHVAHTDIKEANILLPADSSVLAKFEKGELKRPIPRKQIDRGAIYMSREMETPQDFGAPVLCDFGSAIPLDDELEHREDIQPDVYRAPEVVLDIPWTYSVDIWNVGCMIWDAFEGEHLFTGIDPEHGSYRGRAHLAEMIALLGPPPLSLLARANLRSKFFSDEGIPVPGKKTLEDREITLLGDKKGEDRSSFLRLMRKMLQWEPEKRSSPLELAEDEWILKHISSK